MSAPTAVSPLPALGAALVLLFGMPAPLAAQSDSYLNYLDHASIDYAHYAAVQSNMALYYRDSYGNLKHPSDETIGFGVFTLFSAKEFRYLPYNRDGISRVYGENGWFPSGAPFGTDISLTNSTEISYPMQETPIPPALGSDPDYIQMAMMTGTRNSLYFFNLKNRVRNLTIPLSTDPSTPVFTPGNALLATGAYSALLTTNGGIYSWASSTSNGRVTPFITAQGSGPGELSNPSALNIGPDGLLYVLDYGNNRIQKFDRETGSYRGEFALPAGATVSPTSLAISTEGHIYLGDGVGGGFVFNLTGTLLTTFHPPADDPSWVDGGLITTAGPAGVGSFLNYDGMGNVFTYVEGKGLFMYRDPSYNELDNVNLNVLSAVTSAPGNAIFNSLSFDDPRAVLGDRRNGTLTIVEPVQVRTGNIYTENGSVGTIEGGSIVTAGDVTKINAGTLILNNTNTYTGKTIVQDGTLIVNGSVAGEVVVKSGTQLGGHGTIGGLTTISSGGTLAPGNSPGTLTFTNGLTLEAGAVLEFQLGTTSDLITVTGGTLTGPTSGLVTLNLADAGGFTAASYTLFDFSGAATSSFTASDFTLGTTISGYTYNLALVGNTLQLTATASAVPEPSTYAILAGLAALGFVAVRRRRTAAR